MTSTLSIARERRAAHKATYRATVADVARGNPIDPDALERILANAGKTLADLERDAENLRGYWELEAKAAECERLEARHGELSRQHSQLRDEWALKFQQFERDRDAAFRTIGEELFTIGMKLGEARNAATKFHELKARQAAIDSKQT